MFYKKLRFFIHDYGFVCLFFIFLLIFLVYPNVGIYDWDKEILYTTYIKASILEYKQFPLFLWNNTQLAGYPAVDQSALFAANPETILFSPFLPLLLFLSPVIFLKILLLLNAALGIGGIFMLQKELSWQPQQTRIFAILFLFSPIIFQHVAIGYLPWINLYLFPWLLFFLLSDKIFPRAIGSGMVLAMILLQGGLHIFVWFSFFIIFYILCNVILHKNIAELSAIPLIFIISIILSFPRFYLSLKSFATFSQRFFSGYSLKAFIKWGLVPPFFTPRSMDDIESFIEGYIDGVPYWDGAIFWGFVLILVILLPLFLSYLKNRQKIRKENSTIISIAFASSAMLILSMDGIYAKGITAISQWIRFPGLEGMEKYPFRLAIPAYFGFAFVISATWPEWPDFLLQINEWLHASFISLCKLLQKFGNILGRYRKTIEHVGVVFILLVVLMSFLRGYLLNWLNGQINLAYKREGANWLAEMMENTSTIPIERYINKVATLYSHLQYFLLYILAFCCLLWLIGFFRFSPQEKAKSRTHQNSFPMIMEMLLLMPLLLAFCMWWRVSLATPQNSVATLRMKAPEIKLIPANDSATAEIISYSPLSLLIRTSSKITGSRIIFQTIPASDSQFLRVQTGNASFFDYGGKLGIKIEKSGEIKLEANQEYVILPAIIALTGWILCVIFFLKHGLFKKQGEATTNCY